MEVLLASLKYNTKELYKLMYEENAERVMYDLVRELTEDKVSEVARVARAVQK